MSLLNKLFQYVLIATARNNIDESHGLSHSMNVLHYANQIYQSEVSETPLLETQEKIIYASAILHDMCDKKYMNENEGINNMDHYLKTTGHGKFHPSEINTIKKIISTISYSTVKKNGYPTLGGHQRAYHIVREADLLSAYDFDRSMIYHMNRNNRNLIDSFQNAEELFNNRVLKHNEHGLFVTNYSKHMSVILHENAVKRISIWRNLIKNPTFYM